MGSLPGIGVFGSEENVYALLPYLKNSGYSVKAIWSLKIEDAEKASRDLHIPFFTNKIDDVLLRKGVDLILILCSPFHHSQIAVKALGIGKHVIVQSPGGLNQNETLRMVQAAQYYPSINSVLIHGLRFVPAFAQMKSHVQNGYIGSNIRLIDIRINSGSLTSNYSWMCDGVMGGGVLNIYGSHVIDFIHYLTGNKVLRVSGNLRTFVPVNEAVQGIRRISSDDFATFQLEMENNSFASVTLTTHFLEGFDLEVMISGDKGYLIARNGNLEGRSLDSSSESLLYKSSEFFPSNSSFPSLFLHGITALFDHLADNFTHGTKGRWATFEDALYVQAVIEAIKNSSKSRCWAKVNLLEVEENFEESSLNNSFFHSGPQASFFQ